jgi:hypothetical protein
MEQTEKLISEIEKTRTEFKSENYPMSIGELVSLFEKEELIINPDFQRFFRWTDLQKSKLIESLLLGIPIPTVFVFQRDDGIWELVDGLQRVSTLIQFMGKHPTKKPLKLQGTKYLPSLQNVIWDKKEAGDIELPQSLKLFLKRAKLNLTIILSETGKNAKFEVFQRLNTGGSYASDQEVRNSLMIMVNKNKYTWLNDLAKNSDFLETISLSDKLIEEQYPMELALRHIALTHYEYSPTKELSDFFDEITEKILNEDNFPLQQYSDNFNKTFKLLKDVFGEDAFKRYDAGKFKGKFLESAFEAISVGVASNIASYTLPNDVEFLNEKVKSIHSEQIFRKNTGSGSNARNRIPKIVPFAKEFFKK